MTIRQLKGTASISSLCLCACFSTGAAQSSSQQDWQFGTSANPTEPTVATNGAGAASAEIILGNAGAGWLPDLIGFGSQTGVWDVGGQNPDDQTQDTRGRISLSITNPAAVSGSSYTDLDLRILQFVDGFLYTGKLEFSIPGANSLGQTIIETLPGPLGGKWVEDRFQWRLTPSPPVVSLTVTGAVNGMLLDRIRVDTAGEPVPDLVITSAQKSEQGLAISWEGGLPPYQVYVTTNLDGGIWEPLGQSTSNTNADVILPAPEVFVRVGGSN